MEGIDVGVLDARVNELLDLHKAEVYRELVMVGAPDHYSADWPITTGAGTVQYPLPDNFWKAVRLLRVLDANRSVPVTEINGHERGYYQPPQGTFSLTLEYIPGPPIWTQDSDTFDGIAGYEEYIAKLTAVDLLRKESSDANALRAECAEIRKDIRSSGKRTKTAQSITDVTFEEDDFWYWSGTNTIRAWRLRAGNIEVYERRVRP